MKKTIAIALSATLLAGTAAYAQEVRPLESTASTQAAALPFFAAGTIPAGAIIVGTFVVLSGVIIGTTDGT